MSDVARVVVLASGSGSNFQAILDAVAAGALRAQVVGLVVDRAGAGAVGRAQAADVAVLHAPFSPFKELGRAAYDAALAERVAALRPDFVVLAGWLRILGPAFLDRFPGRVLNLHPALPGEFAGLHGIRRAWDERQTRRHSGVMVHLAVPEVDAGPVLGRAVVPLRPEDALDAFEARMHKAEHRLLVAVLQRCVTDGVGALRAEGGLRHPPADASTASPDPSPSPGV